MLHDIPAIGTIYYCVVTVAAGVFVGASTALAVSAYGAAVDSNSMEEFADQGQAALVSTMVGGAAGGATAYNYPGHNCFVAGTAVLTSIGARNIETVQPGDLVWAWDEDTGDVSLKKVVETYVNETDELVHIWADGEEIVATPSHPFYSPVKGWTEAVRLRAGDVLVLVNGEYVVVERVQHEFLESPVTVYNFQVEDYHTYYVGQGITVHNSCKGETSATKRGREMHEDWDYGPDVVKEQKIGPGARVDGLDEINHIVYELKPNNPRAIARGLRQLDRYLAILGESDWAGVLVLYD